MTRSTKYPMAVMTPQIDKDRAHRQVRRHVNQTLQTMDYDNIPVIDIEADTRSLKLEEHGTKIGFDPSEILSEEKNNSRKILTRK